VDNIKINLAKIGCVGMDWIYLKLYMGQWRALAKTVMNLLVPFNIRTFLNICTSVAFQQSAQLHDVG
jgi:hypothetical protein